MERPVRREPNRCAVDQRGGTGNQYGIGALASGTVGIVVHRRTNVQVAGTVGIGEPCYHAGTYTVIPVATVGFDRCDCDCVCGDCHLVPVSVRLPDCRLAVDALGSIAGTATDCNRQPSMPANSADLQVKRRSRGFDSSLPANRPMPAKRVTGTLERISVRTARHANGNSKRHCMQTRNQTGIFAGRHNKLEFLQVAITNWNFCRSP